MRTKSHGSMVHTRTGIRRGQKPTGARLAALAGLWALLILALPPQSAEAQNTERAQVSHVDRPSVKACADRGEIEGLDPQGDGFLAVRTGPSVENEQVDELFNGDVVLLCDYQNGWHRVAYAADHQAAAECSNTTQNTADPRRSSGPCKSGWVHGNWVRMIWN